VPCGCSGGTAQRAGHGTGWLVQASDFFPGREGVLLLTNAHVVSPTPNPRAIFPDESQVNFRALGAIFEVEDTVVWTSAYTKLDATFPGAEGEAVRGAVTPP
jgi:hypothetical protein